MYTKLGTEHLKLVITHMNSGSKIGNLLLMLLELTNIELGATTHSFELHYSKWHKYLTESWLNVTWQFCWKKKIEIRGNYSRLTPARINDVSLMEMLVMDDQ